MHAASRHGTPNSTSLPKDDEVSCEVRPPRSTRRPDLTTHSATRPLNPYLIHISQQRLSRFRHKSYEGLGSSLFILDTLKFIAPLHQLCKHRQPGPLRQIECIHVKNPGHQGSDVQLNPELSILMLAGAF